RNGLISMIITERHPHLRWGWQRDRDAPAQRRFQRVVNSARSKSLVSLKQPHDPSNRTPDAAEQQLKSLDSFKDFSNYLLVTTVAALGWVASDSRVVENPRIEVWCFALSTVCGIFTLAVIPIVAERIGRITDETASFYDVRAPFRPLWFGGF